MLLRAWAGGLVLLASGCLSEPERTTAMPSNPFVTEAFKPPEVRHDVGMPGTKEAADRVLCVGAKVVACNRQMGLRPRFATIGLPKEEIFHRGTDSVFITEGLVRRCETDGQLAAVLALELGKMIAEREAFSDPAARLRDERSPLEMPVGNDFGGTFGPPDGTPRMEMAKAMAEAQRKLAAPPPSPEALARGYLQKAGFKPTDLDDVAPLLRAADENTAAEKMVTIKK